MPPRATHGYTLVEIIVVVTIISILAAVVFMGYIQSTAQARDNARMATLAQLKTAIEAYKDDYGLYPDIGCKEGTASYPTTGARYHDWTASAGIRRWVGPGPFDTSNPSNPVVWGMQCDEYIAGLVPDYLPELPRDSRDNEMNIGLIYSVTQNRQNYKLINWEAVEVLEVQDYNHPFARCPSWCPPADNDVCGDLSVPGGDVQERAYAIYGGPLGGCM